MVATKISIAGAVFALAGCAGLPALDIVKALPGGVTPAVTSVAMLGGDVTVVGPAGYCVDLDSSRPKRGFAMMAPCATLGVADAPAAIAAITTVQAGADGSAVVSENTAAFADYLRGPNGPVVLSRSGDASSVEVSDVRSLDTYVAVSLRDKAPAHIEGAQEDEWRAFVDVNGRLVTISVRGLDEAPLGEASGAALLRQAVKAVIAANSATDT